jgi:hypothetical protein
VPPHRAEELHSDHNLAVPPDRAEIHWLGGQRADLAQEQEMPPVSPDEIEAMSSDEVEPYVVANVGSRPWDRDPIDARIIEDALAGDAAVIDSEAEVEGYPERDATEEAFDPDAWDLDCMERLE